MAEPQSWVLTVAKQLVAPKELPAYFLHALTEADPKLAVDFLRSIFNEIKNNPYAHALMSDFAERVHSSERSLGEWLTQILHVYRWLDNNGRSAKFSDVIEYAACAWHGGNSASIEQFLVDFGFERSWVLPRFPQ